MDDPKDLTTRPLPPLPVAMTEVQSSDLHSIGYDPNGSYLLVRFRDKNGAPGKLYEYQGVPEWVYQDLLDGTGGSRGRFFSRIVKGGGFSYRKVEE